MSVGRSLRACSMTVDGRQNFAVRGVADFRNWKWSSMLGLVRRIFPVTFMSGGCSSAPANFTPKLWVEVSTPSKPRRKSMCHQSRRNSPSVIDCRPTASCSATAPRIAWSSTLRSPAPSISPRAARARAAWSSGGRSKLPTWSARNGGLVAPLIVLLPRQRVGRAPRIGAGGQDARLRIAPRHHRTDTARAGLAHLVTERAELTAGPLGDARLDVQLSRPIGSGPERVDERLGREARGFDRLLRIHAEDQQIQDELQIGLALIVAARTAAGP